MASPLGRDAAQGRTTEPWDVSSFRASVVATVIRCVGMDSKSCPWLGAALGQGSGVG